LLSPLGEPLFRIQAGDAVSRLTNAAYGGPARKTLYICDSYGGRILAAKLPVAGVKLFSHL
jgi:gluconolactonase